jgi:hypothetical protein
LMMDRVVKVKQMRTLKRTVAIPYVKVLEQKLT